jgi:methionyl-tRNA formyltransferase
VTQPDRPAGRGKKLQPTPVKAAALERGLTVLTPEKLRPFVADVGPMNVERAVVASYGRIIPQSLLDAVPLWFNVHPSLLPLYRGATPIQTAISDGRPTTALSIIAMDAGMDTGDLLAQTGPLAIGAGETYGELHDRLALTGADVLAGLLVDDGRGALRRVPQAQRARELGITDAEIAATRTRPWTKDDRAIAVLARTRSAEQIVNHIRALAPKPAASMDIEATLNSQAFSGPLGVLRAHVASGSPLVSGRDACDAGTLVVRTEGMFLKAADSRWVVLDEVLPAGRRAMPVHAFLRGNAPSGPEHLRTAFGPVSGDLLPR